MSQTRPAALALAMLLPPFLSAALLLREANWQEAGVLIGGVYVLWIARRQRAVWLQIAGCVVLTSSAPIACFAVRHNVPVWGWWLWYLSALQAMGGTLAIHARGHAPEAARTGELGSTGSYRGTQYCIVALLLTACYFAALSNWPIAAALALAAGAYQYDLRRQANPEELKAPMTKIGKQSLILTIVYALLLIVGLWDF